MMKTTNRPTSTLEFVSPEIAAEWLKRNTRNRSAKRSKFRIAADLRAGRWAITGASISFAEDGTLLDGQNRLEAVVEAGVGIWTFVVRGLEYEAQDCMDTGDTRRLADQLGIHGEKNANAVASTLRNRENVRRWIAGVKGSLRDYTIARGLEDLAEAEHLAHIATRAGTIGGRTPAKIPTSILGGVWAVLAETPDIDPDDVELFFDQFHAYNVGGEVPTDPYDPIWVLRESLVNKRANSTRGQGLPMDWVAAMVIKAWNLYSAEATVKLLKWNPTGQNPEKFPTPRA